MMFSIRPQISAERYRLQTGFLDFEVDRLGGDAVFVEPVVILDDELKNVTAGLQVQRRDATRDTKAFGIQLFVVLLYILSAAFVHLLAVAEQADAGIELYLLV